MTSYQCKRSRDCILYITVAITVAKYIIYVLEDFYYHNNENNAIMFCRWIHLGEYSRWDAHHWYLQLTFTRDPIVNTGTNHRASKCSTDTLTSFVSPFLGITLLMCIARDLRRRQCVFLLIRNRGKFMDFKILMRTTSGVWLPGCIRLVRYHWFNLFFSRGET